MQNGLQPSQNGLERPGLYLTCPRLLLRLFGCHRGRIHIIVWTALQTRISLCCLHNFQTRITKGHLFWPLVSQSFPCWGVKRRSGSVDRGGWQSHIVWTSAASQRGHCGEWWPRERGLGLGEVTWRGVGSGRGGPSLGTRVAPAGPKWGHVLAF